MAEQAAIDAVVAPVVAAAGLSLVRVQLQGGKHALNLQVMAEDPATRQLTLDQCAGLSRAISDALDTADPIEGEYRLEVSSPGIDRPLTRPQDFADWAGHEAKAELVDALDGRKRFQGVLTGLDGDAFTLDLTDGGSVRLPIAGLKSAKLILTNKLIAATKPLKADDADETEIEESDTDEREQA